MTEEEVLGELAPLTVLLAYVMISTGRSDDAVERLQPIIAGELPQREVAAIAANNWAVACFNTGRQFECTGIALRMACSLCHVLLLELIYAHILAAVPRTCRHLAKKCPPSKDWSSSGLHC
jgi:hypothetical protein